jgi:hypothetical protein
MLWRNYFEAGKGLLRGHLDELDQLRPGPWPTCTSKGLGGSQPSEVLKYSWEQILKEATQKTATKKWGIVWDKQHDKKQQAVGTPDG